MQIMPCEACPALLPCSRTDLQALPYQSQNQITRLGSLLSSVRFPSACPDTGHSLGSTECCRTLAFHVALLEAKFCLSSYTPSSNRVICESFNLILETSHASVSHRKRCLPAIIMPAEERYVSVPKPRRPSCDTSCSSTLA